MRLQTPSWWVTGALFKAACHTQHQGGKGEEELLSASWELGQGNSASPRSDLWGGPGLLMLVPLGHGSACAERAEKSCRVKP